MPAADCNHHEPRRLTQGSKPKKIGFCKNVVKIFLGAVRFLCFRGRRDGQDVHLRAQRMHAARSRTGLRARRAAFREAAAGACARITDESTLYDAMFTTTPQFCNLSNRSDKLWCVGPSGRPRGGVYERCPPYQGLRSASANLCLPRECSTSGSQRPGFPRRAVLCGTTQLGGTSVVPQCLLLPHAAVACSLFLARPPP